jgi:hypothetical protein
MCNMFQKFRRLPNYVEAVQFTDEDKDRIYNELTGQYAADYENGKPILKVTTAHGEIAIIRIGDWIVKDIEIGTYYPVKDKFFRENYA